MCLVLQLSLSSKPSLPNAGFVFSEGTHMMTLPSSPAEARISPAKYVYYVRKRETLT